MIRRTRFRTVITIAATAFALSSCATFTNTDVVARIGDASVTNDEFASLADEFFANPDVFGTTPAQQGRADADQSRGLLAVIVRQRLINQFLDRQGIDASDLRQQFKESALAGSPAGQLSDEIQDLIADIDTQSSAQAFSQIESPGVDELRALYADAPPSTGVVCLRHILTDTEADAQQILRELEQGADFAALAAERSIDPTAADSGGALANGSNQCIPARTVFESFDPRFTAGAMGALEGVPSQPVESSFGWHVILHRPWDEVAESVVELHQPGDSGGLLFDGYVATADVEIDPRLGSWDPNSAAITPIG